MTAFYPLWLCVEWICNGGRFNSSFIMLSPILCMWNIEFISVNIRIRVMSTLEWRSHAEWFHSPHIALLNSAMANVNSDGQWAHTYTLSFHPSWLIGAVGTFVWCVYRGNTLIYHGHCHCYASWVIDMTFAIDPRHEISTAEITKSGRYFHSMGF